MSSIGHLVFNGFFPKVNQIITNTQKTTTSNLIAFQPTFHKISRPQALLGGHFFKISSVSHLAFNIFFPKVNQIIRNNQRTTTSNLNAIQPMVHMISRPMLFGRTFFQLFSVSNLVFNKFFPKVNQIIRNTRRTTYKI